MFVLKGNKHPEGMQGEGQECCLLLPLPSFLYCCMFRIDSPPKGIR